MNSSKIIDRSNNFDLLRLVLASFVIISHSYPLTKNKEILSSLTNGQVDFGGLAVNSFFALSGYFIFLSLQRSKTISNYIWKRILRLYPALIVLFIFTLIVIPFVYVGTQLTSALKDYWHYAVKGLSLFKVSYTILIAISLLFNFYLVIAPFTLSFLVIFIEILSTKYINGYVENLAICHTAFYIYGFIVQQILMIFFNLSPLSLMIISLTFTYILAYLSWHFVEEKMLKYKNLIK